MEGLTSTTSDSCSPLTDGIGVDGVVCSAITSTVSLPWGLAVRVYMTTAHGRQARFSELECCLDPDSLEAVLCLDLTGRPSIRVTTALE